MNDEQCYDPTTGLYVLCSPSSPAEPSTPWGSYLWYGLLVVLGIAVLVLLIRSIHIVKQYQRGVVYRLGRASDKVRMPGLRFTIPLIEWVVKVPVATEALELKPQEVITKDDVSLTVQAVIFLRVANARAAEIEVDDYEEAIKQRGQSVLRQVIGSMSLEKVLAQSAEVVGDIKSRLAALAEAWGLDVQSVELKDIQLPKGMKRAMAAKAEAEREAKAKVIAAQGERDSAELLAQAAEMLTPTAVRLRELQVLQAIGAEQNTVVVIDSSAGTVAGQAAAGQLAGQQSTAE